MPIPELISPEVDPCTLASRWGISDELAEKLVKMTWDLQDVPVSIISGLRTEKEQDALRRAGRPTADNDRSTHLSCPATGADVRPQIVAVNAVIWRLGTEGQRAGLRWGGASKPAPEGWPSDWNHFDLGPRA